MPLYSPQPSRRLQMSCYRPRLSSLPDDCEPEFGARLKLLLRRPPFERGDNLCRTKRSRNESERGFADSASRKLILRRRRKSCQLAEKGLHFPKSEAVALRKTAIQPGGSFPQTF